MALAIAITGGGTTWAQGNPLSADVKKDYKNVRDYFVRAAEKMPDADYAFKPSPDVRSFGQQVAHVADDQYNLCAPAKGETRQAAYTDIENRLSKKTDLIPALKDAFAYCDAAYDALTDASGREIVKFGKSDKTKFAMLNWNLWHTWEHYGNVVVYLRIKGLVPPSSERTQAGELNFEDIIGFAAYNIRGQQDQSASHDPKDATPDCRQISAPVVAGVMKQAAQY